MRLHISFCMIFTWFLVQELLNPVILYSTWVACLWGLQEEAMLVLVLCCLRLHLLVLKRLDVLVTHSILTRPIVSSALYGKSFPFLSGLRWHWDTVTLMRSISCCRALSILDFVLVQIFKWFLRHGVFRAIMCVYCSRWHGHVVVTMVESDWSHWLVTFFIHSAHILLWGLSKVLAPITTSVHHLNVLVEGNLVSC